MEVGTGETTMTVVDPLICPELAVIIAFPRVLACTSPMELTEATAGVEDDQVTNGVMFSASPVRHVPVAVNCCCSPRGRDESAGVRPIVKSPVSDPVPDRATVCGLVPALSVTVSVPVWVPSAVGV